MIKYLLIALVAFVAYSCGGGGGNSSNNDSQPPPVQRTDLLYGYFGSAENPSKGPWFPSQPGIPSSVDETARTVNLVITGGWGDWNSVDGRLALMDRAIKIIQSGQSYGIHKYVLTVDFLLYKQGTNGTITYRGRDAALTDIEYFINRLKDSGTFSDIIMLYPLDEPNIQKIDPQAVEDSFTDLRNFLDSKFDTAQIGLFVIYGNIGRGLPGISLLKMVGVDDYDKGVGVLDEIDQLRTNLHIGQQIVLIPGGASPWRQAPQKFLDYANEHPDVAMIMPFLWFDYNLVGSGIRSNGMRELYEHIGCLIKGTKC